MTATSKSPAGKFRQLAAGMVEKIEHLRRPMSQRSTPKRQKEYASRCIDGANLDRGRLALLALAAAWDRGEVPPALQDLRNRDDVCRLVRHGVDTSGGYYSIVSTYEYADTSDAGRALQALLAAHATREDRERLEKSKQQMELDRLLDEIRFQKIPGFFPTPPAVVSLLLAYAQIEPSHRVLEPSAGIGSIVQAIRAAQPKAFIHAVEVRSRLSEILAQILPPAGAAPNYLPMHADFLECTADGIGTFDRIVMNPPFEKGQDIDHVRHAYSVLAPGGRLVAVMSSGPFYREDSKSETFCDWLDFVDHTVDDLPDDAFNGADAFRTTGVKCKVLVIDK